MNDLYYTREFFYRERVSFEEFFEENALWKTIYDFFEGKKYDDGCYHVRLNDFNEAYLRFNEIMVDYASPEEYEEELTSGEGLGISDICFDALLSFEDDDYEVDFCLSLLLLYLLLALRDDLTEPQKMILKSFDDEDFEQYQKWFYEVKFFVAELKSKGEISDIWYGAMPERPETFSKCKSIKSTDTVDINIEGLWYNCNWWSYTTNSFDLKTTREVLELWKDPRERLQMAKIISDRYYFYFGERHGVKRFITGERASLLVNVRDEALKECNKEKAFVMEKHQTKEKVMQLELEVARLSDELKEKNFEVESLRRKMHDVLNAHKSVSDILRYAEELEKSDAKVVKSMIDSVYRGVKFSEEEARRIDALAKRERRSGVPGVVIENMHGSVNGSVTQNIDKGNDNKLIDR